jgi:hypothetical protein
MKTHAMEQIEDQVDLRDRTKKHTSSKHKTAKRIHLNATQLESKKDDGSLK